MDGRARTAADVAPITRLDLVTRPAGPSRGVRTGHATLRERLAAQGGELTVEQRHGRFLT
ncbi:two-component sensor histidine kinase, partial [Marinitenerispora sediminis]